MEEAEEAAAEAEAEGGAGLHLEAERGVVEAELVEAVAELLEVVGVDREEAAEDDRLDELEAGERLAAAGRLASVMVSPTRVSATSLICAVMKPISPGPSSVSCSILGRKQPTRSTRWVVPAAMNLTCAPFFRHAVDDADEDDDAEIGVVPAVDEHRLERSGGVALGRRDLGDDRVEHFLDADAGLGAGEDGVGGVEADDLLDLLPHAFGVGGGEVDLVDDRHDLVVVLDRLVDVGEGLRLDPLRGVDHQQRALARGEAARHLVGEVDVAGRVHQVELVALPLEPHGLRLDGDPALALDVHIVEHLRWSSRAR